MMASPRGPGINPYDLNAVAELRRKHKRTAQDENVWPWPQARKGWECPKCGHVYAPFIPECNNCNQKEKEDDG